MDSESMRDGSTATSSIGLTINLHTAESLPGDGQGLCSFWSNYVL